MGEQPVSCEAAMARRRAWCQDLPAVRNCARSYAVIVHFLHHRVITTAPGPSTKFPDILKFCTPGLHRRSLVAVPILTQRITCIGMSYVLLYLHLTLLTRMYPSDTFT
jgi:hypothetical protein